ncbi:MAG: c-type cytochrome [Terrimonas sp.]|nr:c-type cytochrome [Terrimonas sp.]
MKKIFSFFLLLIFPVLIIFYACSSPTAPTAISKEDSIQHLWDRGNYLVHSVVNCVDCHSKLDFNKFSFPMVPGTEGMGGFAVHELMDDIPGKIFIPNITPYALKDWTDEEIARAMTRGINKRGDTLFPMMPYHGLSHMAKSDVDAVITYLRKLKPIANDVPPHQLFVPASVFGPLPDNDYHNNTLPDTTDAVKYGQYLVSIAHCTDCHTQFTKEGAPDMTKYLAGGQHFKLPTFEVTVANITPDKETGIGAWTEDMFLAKFRTNASAETVNADHGKFGTLMPWTFFGTMRDKDLKAIYAYLRTIPPVNNKIDKWGIAKN